MLIAGEMDAPVRSLPRAPYAAPGQTNALGSFQRGLFASAHERGGVPQDLESQAPMNGAALSKWGPRTHTERRPGHLAARLGV